MPREDVYPCTIINDRYNGAYSGALWLAFPIDFSELPEAINADDISSMAFWERSRHLDYEEIANFWDGRENLSIGKGDSPAEAYTDLSNQMKAKESA